MKLIIEKSNGYYLLSDLDAGNTIVLNDRQVKMLFKMLQKEPFKDVYMSAKNLDDLIIKFEDAYLEDVTVYIKGYQQFKNDLHFNQIKGKINKGLTAHALRNVGSRLKANGVKIIAITAVGVIVLTGTTYVIKRKFGKVENLPTRPSESQSSNDSQDTSEKDESQNDTPTKDENQQQLISDDHMKRKEIESLFAYYGEIFEFDEYLTLKLCAQNVDIVMQSENIEQAVIDILYDYYETNLYQVSPIQINNHTEDEQQLAILKYAKVRGIDNKDILLTMLAVHQLETGHGTSVPCKKYNNLGGIFGTNPNTNIFELKMYPNLQVAAIDFNNVFVRIMNRCRNEEWYDPSAPLEKNMNPIYCTEKMDEDDPEWYQVVGDLKNRIQEDGLLQRLEQKLLKGDSKTL